MSKKKLKLKTAESSRDVKQKIHLGFYEIGDRISGLLHDLDRDIYSHKDMDDERRKKLDAAFEALGDIYQWSMDLAMSRKSRKKHFEKKQ
jgi:hypothetical protein